MSVYLDKDQQFSTYFMTQNGEPTQINYVAEQKELGVTIDNKLKFVSQMQPMVKKLTGI